MRKFLVLTIISLVFISCSQNTVKESEKVNADSDKTDQMEKVQKNIKGESNKPVKKDKKIIVPKEVSDKYKSLIIEIRHLNTNKTVETNILIGQKAEIAGTPLVIEVEAYLPDFTMKDNSVMTSKSATENNPAAKIKVYKNEQLVFDGWLFKNYPNTHSFEDPDYKLLMKSAVNK
jgi:predicted RND superfamily exporter protein